jgi:hypothetical protein
MEVDLSPRKHIPNSFKKLAMDSISTKSSKVSPYDKYKKKKSVNSVLLSSKTPR